MLHTTNPFIIPSPLPSSIAYSSIHRSPRFSPSCNPPTPSPSPKPRRKRVVFEEKDLQMANKHETAPTALKPPGEFRETIKIGSASSWDKVTLELFHVMFNKTEYTELRGSTYIDERYFEAPPENEKCHRGYFKIMRSLEEARDVDIPQMGKEDLVVRFEDNPLCEFFVLLRDFMVGPSAEAMELRQQKNRSRTPSPKKRSKLSNSQNDDNEIEFIPEIPPSQISISSSSDITTPVKKRNISGGSGGSFGTDSTETSPAKLSQAEQYTQNLQSTLIAKLINCVWRGEATVQWAENRKMYLEYRPHFTSSFRCRLEGNNGDTDDRIIANPDGALSIITNKKSGSNRTVIWSLQEAALAFEAKKADIKWVEALMAKGLEQADAKAHATAAQIWAEMLGLVCHPEYYKLGDQTAFVVHFSGYHACIYYATFPTDYLSTIQHEGIHALKSTFNNPLPLHHTEPCNLLHPDARLHFIQDFIAIVRCLADGCAPIGYLRRDDPQGKIHRKLNDEEEVVRPPQQALEQRKESEWRQEKGSEYAV